MLWVRLLTKPPNYLACLIPAVLLWNRPQCREIQNGLIFPRPLTGHDTLDFSFSGLKTAVRQVAINNQPLSYEDIADICASFQAAVCDVLQNRVERIMDHENGGHEEIKCLVVAGGVAANQKIRAILKNCADDADWSFVAPPLALCTDNAAMIAWAGARTFCRREKR